MAPGTHPASPANKHNATTQQYLAWLLVALVVLYCSSARPGGYNPLHHNSKSINNVAYLDNEESRLGTSLAALLLLWWVARATSLTLGSVTASQVSAAVQSAGIAGGFDREFRIRPPPRS
ncbi:MAG TPA: hypothetical protein VN620_13840 [Candidatus Methylomirabilis sp.]|nr:hypothetical protein [Candidatus Methylomirabilis sp.]